MLGQTIFAEVFDLATEMEALGRRAARAVAQHGLLEVDGRLLFGLLPLDLTQAQLARSLAMDSGQIARTVQRLVRKGLVEPSPHQVPRKGSQALRLTLNGKKAAIDAQARRAAVIQEYLKDEARIGRLLRACSSLSDRHYTNYDGPFVRAAETGDFGSFLSPPQELF